MKNNRANIELDLEAIAGAIVKTVPVEEIYLFGSYAYGTPGENSDIDLYLVFKDDMQMRESEAFTRARSALFGIQLPPVDLLGQRKQKFMYRSTGFATIEKEVCDKGVKLYG